MTSAKPDLGIKFLVDTSDNTTGKYLVNIVENDRGEWEEKDAGDTWCHLFRGFGGENTLMIILNHSYFCCHVMVIDTCVASESRAVGKWIYQEKGKYEPVSDEALTNCVNELVAEVYSDRTNKIIRQHQELLNSVDDKA